MKQGLRLADFGLSASGPGLSLSLGPGQILGVAGRAGSGKSRFLAAVSGEERPARGKVQASGEWVRPSDPSRRSKVQAAALRRIGDRSAAHVLSSLGLWDARALPASSLTPSGWAALRCAVPLAAGSGELAAFDGDLDALDPVAFAGARRLLVEAAERGATLVVASHRPELLEIADALVLMRGGRVGWSGTPEELLRRAGPNHLTVESEDQRGVRALVEPFEVRVSQDGPVLRLEAAEGQALAAKLLRDGYGDVRYVVVRQPTFAEALASALAG